MTSKEAAAYLGISPFYLRNMRQSTHNHDGPAYSMVIRPRAARGGMQADYLREDLDAWKRQHSWRNKDAA